MIDIIQTNSSIHSNGKEIDFQSRIFQYESFKKLIEDFEGDKFIMVCGSMNGALKPRESRIECLIKDDFHASYRVANWCNMITITRFYVCQKIL